MRAYYDGDEPARLVLCFDFEDDKLTDGCFGTYMNSEHFMFWYVRYSQQHIRLYKSVNHPQSNLCFMSKI
jgi:hypothetical protein